MTIANFFEELEQTPQTWRLLTGGRIVGALEDERSELRYCPITAVYERRSGVFVRMGEYYVAAEGLGLPPALALQIISAADRSNTHYRGIRKSLLSALRLEEERNE